MIVSDRFARLFIFLVACLLPFSYFEIGGVRLILFQIIFLLFFCFCCGVTFVYNHVWLFSSLMLMFVAFFGVINGVFELLAGFVVFSLFSLWPFFVRGKSLHRVGAFDVAVKGYIFGVLLAAVGVIVQRFVFLNFGVEIGRIDRFLNRTAFSFFWLDYSFLSLYIVSAIPLLYFRCKRFVFVILSIFLLYASLATSARTGVVGFALALFIYFLCRVIGIFSSGKVRVADISSVLGMLALVFISPMMLSAASDREISASDSGRFDGYWNALGYFSSHPVFGAEFVVGNYTNFYAVLPHNLFLYFLVMGGVVGFVLFVCWALCCFVCLARYSKYSSGVAFSVLIVFFGLQFIPSFYSSYFLGFLLSLIFSLQRSAE